MVDRLEMPAENMENKPEESGVKKAVSAEEYWENYRKNEAVGMKVDRNESSHEAMKRIEVEVKDAATARAESIREITDGIKRRLNDWRKEDLHTLKSHLDEASNLQNYTFDEGFSELLAKCEEGTEAGRVWRDEKGEVKTRISRNPKVASRALVDRLSWVINHDDTALGVRAGKIISLAELRDLVKEVLKG